MDKNRSLTYILSLNEFGQKICTSQTAPFKKYLLDEDGNMSEYQPEDSISAITIDDNSQESSHETDSNELSTNLEDTANLGIMNPLDQGVTDFEQNLMDELDSEIMSMVNPTPSYVMQHMDIRDPLSKLKKLLSQRFGIDLTGYKFRLQDMQELEDHKNLVEQCVQGEGPVQINVQIQPASRKINILDVLQPADGYVHVEEEPTEDITITRTSTPTSSCSNQQQNLTSVEEVDSTAVNTVTSDVSPDGLINITTTSVPKYENDIEEVEDEEYLEDDNLQLIDGQEPSIQNIVQWQTDAYYKQKQEELGIPNDPELWTSVHVAHWIQWAVKEFKLKGVDLRDWHMDGKQLFDLSMSQFQRICPKDPGDVFWTHLELLRKMKEVTTRKVDLNNGFKISAGKRKKNSRNAPRQTDSFGNNIGFNGQIQLWQFLLDLLTSKQHKTIIQWTGYHGEFKFTHPEVVAALWGERKNKPMMNYEKLSRALRYYYDGDMISKVHGKRFVYRFVCDLKPLIGYSAMELANLMKYGDPKRSLTLAIKPS